MVNIYKNLKCEFRYEILIFILYKLKYIDKNSSLDIEILYKECSDYIRQKEKYYNFRDQSYIKKYWQDVLDELNVRKIIKCEIGEIILLDKQFALEMINIDIINKVCSDILVEIVRNNKKINENFDCSHIYLELNNYEKSYFDEAINQLISEKLVSYNGYVNNIALTQKGFDLIISDKDDTVNKIYSKILDKIKERVYYKIDQNFNYCDLYSELNKYEKLYFYDTINKLESEGLISHDKNIHSIKLTKNGFYRIYPINN